MRRKFIGLLLGLDEIFSCFLFLIGAILLDLFCLSIYNGHGPNKNLIKKIARIWSEVWIIAMVLLFLRYLVVNYFIFLLRIWIVDLIFIAEVVETKHLVSLIDYDILMVGFIHIIRAKVTIDYKSNCIYLPPFMDNIDLKINGRYNSSFTVRARN